MDILKFFDKIVCLSVDKRAAQWEEVDKQFAQYGGQVEHFVAGDGQILPKDKYDHIDDPNPPRRVGFGSWSSLPNSYNAFSCFKKIIFKAIDDKLENILICEDDVKLSDKFAEVFPKSIQQLQDLNLKWDMFYLGANHTWAPTQEVSPNLLKLNGSLCWHCVGIRNTLFEKILQLPQKAPIDFITANSFHPKYNCYAVWPNIAFQKEGWSYCQHSRQSYYNFLKNKGNNHNCTK